MKHFKIVFKNIAKKSYIKVIERTVTVDAYDDRHAKILIYNQFGNEKKIEIVSVEEIAEENTKEE